MSVRNHNYAIDAYRSVLIIWIILFHYSQYTNMGGNPTSQFSYQFMDGGPVGVTLFFILSGYFMGHHFFDGQFYSIKEYGLYCAKRYWRFWPSYALALVFILLWLKLFPVSGLDKGIWVFVYNFFLIIHPNPFFAGAHWFLTVLLISQFFIILFRFLPKYRLFCLIIVMTVIGLFLAFFTMQPSLGISTLRGTLKVMLGIVLYKLTNEQNLLTFSGILLGTLFVVLDQSHYLTTFIPYFLVMLILLTTNIPVPSCMHNAIHYLGSISFTWYLVHEIIGYSIMTHWLPSGKVNMLWILLPMFVTLILSMITYCFAQKIQPLIKFKKT